MVKMKKLILILAIGLSITSCNKENPQPNNPSFEETPLQNQGSYVRLDYGNLATSDEFIKIHYSYTDINGNIIDSTQQTEYYMIPQSTNFFYKNPEVKLHNVDWTKPFTIQAAVTNDYNKLPWLLNINASGQINHSFTLIEQSSTVVYNTTKLFNYSH